MSNEPEVSTQFDLAPQHLDMLRTGSGISDERSTLESADPKMVVLRALREMFVAEVGDAGTLQVSASRVAETVCRLIEEEELEIPRDRMTATRAARVTRRKRSAES